MFLLASHPSQPKGATALPIFLNPDIRQHSRTYSNQILQGYQLVEVNFLQGTPRYRPEANICVSTLRMLILLI